MYGAHRACLSCPKDRPSRSRGGFYAPNTLALAFLIDEILNPEDCEYILIGSGGIVWSGPAIEIPVPSDDNDSDDPTAEDPFPWTGAGFTERWWALVYYDSRKRWRRIEYDLEDLYGIDPEEPDPEPLPPTKPAQVVAFKKPKKRRIRTRRKAIQTQQD